jgi:hypothetical protein
MANVRLAADASVLMRLVTESQKAPPHYAGDITMTAPSDAASVRDTCVPFSRWLCWVDCPFLRGVAEWRAVLPIGPLFLRPQLRRSRRQSFHY